jgi:hypothetical protein
MPAADAPKRGAARRKHKQFKGVHSDPAQPANASSQKTHARVKQAKAAERAYQSQGESIARRAKRADRAAARAPSVHGHLGLGTSPRHIRTLNVKKHLEGVAHSQQARTQEQQYAREGYKSSVKRKGPSLISAAGIGGGLDKFLSGKTTAGAVRSIGDFLAKSAAAGPIASTIPGTGEFLGNAARDLVDIPSSVIPSLYVPGKDIATGHPGKAAQFLATPFIEAAKHPRKSFMEHPLGTALLLRGGYGAIDRGVGMGLRASPSQVLRNAGSVARPARDVVLPGTHQFDAGRYSKGIITKTVQAAQDKGRLPRYERGRGITSEPVGPRVMNNKQIAHRANETVAVNEDMRRLNRGVVSHDVIEALRPATPNRLPKRISPAQPSAATAILTQNITHPNYNALVEYRTQLEHEAKGLQGVHDAAKLEANVKTRSDITAALKKFDAEGQHEAARNYAGLSLRLRKELQKHNIITKEQDDAALVPYAVQHMGAEMRPARVVDSKTGKPINFHEQQMLRRDLTGAQAKARIVHEPDTLIDPNGVKITPEDIRAHMEHNGFAEPAFVSQRPNMRGSKNFAPQRVQSVGGELRTGLATKQGTADFHPDTLLQQAVKSQGLIDAHVGHQRFLKEFGLRGDKGTLRVFGRRTGSGGADAAAAEYNARHPNGPRVVAVRSSPLGAKRKQTEDLIHNDEKLGEHVRDTMIGALKGEGDDTGPWVLVPETAAKTFAEHLQGNSVHPALTKANSLWRTNVLLFSPKWFFGNSIEAALRAGAVGAGYRSWKLAHRALAELERTDPVAAKEARLRLIAGGHYALASRNVVHSPAEAFQGKALEGLARHADAFWRNPAPATMANLYHELAHFVFNTLNGKIESQFQTAMLGKALRQDPLMSEHFLKTSKAAVEDAAKGLKNTNNQVRLGREVDRMYGKYGKFSPAMRKAIANYTPFVAWSRNAVQFLFSVLPKDHPVLTSLLASANIASEDWRKNAGLKVDPIHNLPGAVPGFLVGSLPLPRGKHLGASRSTPFGIASGEGGILGNLASTILPQFSDVKANMEGKDWKGQSLAGPHKTSTLGRNAVASVVSIIEGMIPATTLGATVTGVHLPNEAEGTQHPDAASARIAKWALPLPVYAAKSSKSTTGRRKKATSSGWGSTSRSSGSW